MLTFSYKKTSKSFINTLGIFSTKTTPVNVIVKSYCNFHRAWNRAKNDREGNEGGQPVAETQPNLKFKNLTSKNEADRLAGVVDVARGKHRTRLVERAEEGVLHLGREVSTCSHSVEVTTSGSYNK